MKTYREITIYIDSCYDCLYHDEWTDYNRGAYNAEYITCSYEKIDESKEIKGGKIPKWCPLPKVKK